MISICPQQNVMLLKQDTKINPATSHIDFSLYPSNSFQFTPSFIQENPNKSFQQGLNPLFSNFQKDSSYQYFSNHPKINQSILPHQAIQASLYSRQHKIKWTYDEDVRLKEAVEKFGTDSWIRISQFVPGRNSKQCRERWMGQLAPSIKKESWSKEEDEILIHQHELIGNKWTAIATFLPGRSAINVKNRWSKIKRIKEDILVSAKSNFHSVSNSSEFKKQFNGLLLNSNFNEYPSHKENLDSSNKKNAHKINKIRNSNSSSRRRQKEKKNNESSYKEYDEESSIKNNEKFAVIKEKSSGIVFEFPTIDNIPLFGQDFAQFQAQMLK